MTRTSAFIWTWGMRLSDGKVTGHMPNEENLLPTQFTSENQPKNRKSRKGIPNRATVFKKWLTAKIQIDDPKATDKDAPKITVTMMEAAALGQIEAAMRGKTDAWKEIQDSLHGKQVDKTELSNPDGTGIAEPLANAISQFEKALLKVYGDQP